MSLLAYLVVAMLVMHTDAMLCYALKRKFRLVPGIVSGLAWPVMVPLAILGSASATRDCPRTSVPLTGNDPSGDST